MELDESDGDGEDVFLSSAQTVRALIRMRAENRLRTAVCLLVLAGVEFGAGVRANVDGLQFGLLAVDAQPVGFALRRFRDGGVVAGRVVGIGAYAADREGPLKMFFWLSIQD